MSRADFGRAATAALIVLGFGGACGSGDGPEGLPRVDTGGGQEISPVNGTRVRGGVGPGIGTGTTGNAGRNAGTAGSGAQPVAGATASGNADQAFIGVDEIDTFDDFRGNQTIGDLNRFGSFAGAGAGISDFQQ